MDQKNQSIIDRAREEFGINLISVIENYDSCELQTITRLYMSFQDYQTEKGKTCFRIVSSNMNPIFVKGPTSFDLLGYDDQNLSVNHVASFFQKNHDKIYSQDAACCVITEIVNDTYQELKTDTYFGFEIYQKGVVYNTKFGNVINKTHFDILKKTLELSIEKIKNYLVVLEQ